jgi:hypothetical protein
MLIIQILRFLLWAVGTGAVAVGMVIPVILLSVAFSNQPIALQVFLAMDEAQRDVVAIIEPRAVRHMHNLPRGHRLTHDAIG